MYIAVDIKGIAVIAEHGLSGDFHCPECGEKVICATHGEKNAPHFRHESGKMDCIIQDEWKRKDYNNEWHIGQQRDIKKYFGDQCEIEKTIGVHRADAVINGVVIEYQHSPIKADTIKEREDYYKNMVWVLDGNEGAAYEQYIDKPIPSFDRYLPIFINVNGLYKPKNINNNWVLDRDGFYKKIQAIQSDIDTLKQAKDRAYKESVITILNSWQSNISNKEINQMGNKNYFDIPNNEVATWAWMHNYIDERDFRFIYELKDGQKLADKQIPWLKSINYRIVNEIKKEPQT